MSDIVYNGIKTPDRMTITTKDIKTFNKGWEEAFSGKNTTIYSSKATIVEAVGHATRVVPNSKLREQLRRIEVQVLKIRNSPSGLAKGLKVQYLLDMFDEDSGKMK